MNNKGQTLLAFVLLLPVFIIFLAFVVDTGYFLKENTKLNNLTKTILKETYDDFREDKIKELYKINNIEPTYLKITNYEIEVKTEVDSIFGSIIGLKSYEIQTKMQITKDNNEFIITKE